MSTKMTRRSFLKCGVAASASLLVGGNTAFADQDSPVQFTEDVAKELAQRFVDSTFPEKSLYADQVTRIYTTSGNPLGYIVDYVTASGSDSGYIVYDISDPTLISEFAVDEGAISPYKRAAANITSSLTNRNSSFVAAKVSPFNIAAVDLSSNSGVDMYGRDFDNVSNSASILSVPETPSWNDIFISGVGSTYTIVSMAHAPSEFISYSESEIESATGRYACAVSALLNCAPHYIPQFPFRNFGDEYIKIWDETDSYVTHTANGITYGGTPRETCGSGFKQYCAQYGIDVSYSNAYPPDFASYRNMINRRDMGLFICGINKNGTRVAHAMAVEGYAILKRGNISEDINTLIVADGWDWNARYLNFYYTKYTYTYGVFFS